MSFVVADSYLDGLVVDAIIRRVGCEPYLGSVVQLAEELGGQYLEKLLLWMKDNPIDMILGLKLLLSALSFISLESNKYKFYDY
jgi:hypothetical protein